MFFSRIFDFRAIRAPAEGETHGSSSDGAAEPRTPRLDLKARGGPQGDGPRHRSTLPAPQRGDAPLKEGTVAKAGITPQTLNHLRIPLSMIETVADLDAFQGLNVRQLTVLQEQYTAQEIGSIRAALQFAAEHPEHDFASMLPGVQISNDRMHQFLVKIATSLQTLPEPVV